MCKLMRDDTIVKTAIPPGRTGLVGRIVNKTDYEALVDKRTDRLAIAISYK